MELTLDERLDLIKNRLATCEQKDPIAIVKSLMHCDFVSIHGPEHHFLDGASLMRALHNAGVKFDYDKAIEELCARTRKMPGAMCGYWGMCGSVASIGAVLSIIDGTGPLSDDQNYKNHMSFTSSMINKMSEIGGPRCCKRNAFLSILAGVEYAKEHYGVNPDVPKDLKCEFSPHNKQCIGTACPFFKTDKRE